MDRKVDLIEREMFEGSLKMGVGILQLMGRPAHQAVRAAGRFRLGLDNF